MKRCFLLFLIFISLATPGVLAQTGDTLWISPTKPLIVALKFSPDEKFVYAVTTNGMEKHDATTGALLSEFKGYFKNISYARFSANCKRVIVYSNSDSISIIDIEKETIDWSIKSTEFDTSFNVGSYDISPDGNLVFLTSSQKADKENLMVYDVNQRKPVKTVNHEGIISSIAASPDGKYLAIYYLIKYPYKRGIMLLDAINMKKIKEIDTSGYDGFYFSYDSKKMGQLKYLGKFINLHQKKE